MGGGGRGHCWVQVVYSDFAQFVDVSKFLKIMEKKLK